MSFVCLRCSFHCFFLLLPNLLVPNPVPQGPRAGPFAPDLTPGIVWEASSLTWFVADLSSQAATRDERATGRTTTRQRSNDVGRDGSDGFRKCESKDQASINGRASKMLFHCFFFLS